MSADAMTLEVQIFDTDCYGVMWHGAYTKWLEMGRVAYLKRRGIVLSKPSDPNGHVYPVVAQQFAFRSPARMGDVLTLGTTLTLEGRRLLFSQTVAQASGDRVVMEALTTCVILDAQWKPLRRLPEAFLARLQAHPQSAEASPERA